VADERPESDDLLGDDWIVLSDPDLSELELKLVETAMSGSRLTAGPMVERFEQSFARWLGRAHAVSVASGTWAPGWRCAPWASARATRSSPRPTAGTRWRRR
jgi:hypothetical protein